MEFNQEVLNVIYSINKDIQVREASRNEDAELSFRDEEVGNSNFLKKGIRGIEFNIPEDHRDNIVEMLQEKFENGFTIYFSEQNFGHGEDKITILETIDRMDAIRFEGCNGVNYDIMVEDLIEHLDELEKTHPFIITGVGFDFIQGYFVNPVNDADELAARMYEFCPDIVDQGTETVKALAEELHINGTLFYWWD